MSTAGFVGNYTTTTATRLFQSNCPEQLIAEQTGHTSNAIRRYKKSNLAQKEEVSKLLAGLKSADSVHPVDESSKENVGKDSTEASQNTVETGPKSTEKSGESGTGTNMNISVPNVQQNLSGLVNIHFHFNK